MGTAALNTLIVFLKLFFFLIAATIPNMNCQAIIMIKKDASGHYTYNGSLGEAVER